MVTLSSMVGWRFQTAQLLPFAMSAPPDRRLVHLHVAAQNAGLAKPRSVHGHEKCEPICAPGCKSIPLRPCAHSVMMRGMSGIFNQIKFMRQALTAMARRTDRHDDFFRLSAAGSPLSGLDVRLPQLANRGRLASNSTFGPAPMPADPFSARLTADCIPAFVDSSRDCQHRVNSEAV